MTNCRLFERTDDLHLILTERELQVIYRALSQYDSRDAYAGSTTFHETEERVAKGILDNALLPY